MPDTYGYFYDNYFDLLPGIKKRVTFKTKNDWESGIYFLDYYSNLLKQIIE
jgi:hypothetical protein